MKNGLDWYDDEEEVRAMWSDEEICPECDGLRKECDCDFDRCKHCGHYLTDCSGSCEAESEEFPEDYFWGDVCPDCREHYDDCECDHDEHCQGCGEFYSDCCCDDERCPECDQFYSDCSCEENEDDDLTIIRNGVVYQIGDKVRLVDTKAKSRSGNWAEDETVYILNGVFTIDDIDINTVPQPAIVSTEKGERKFVVLTIMFNGLAQDDNTEPTIEEFVDEVQ